jgi:hypothetical protein
MKMSIKLFTATLALVISSNALAYLHPSDQGKSGMKPNKPTSVTKGANCAPANYRKNMEFNDVKAQLETGGLLFLDRANGLATYRVPKSSPSTLIYAGALWMGGTDVNGQLKLAAVKFRSSGNDFWPGPLTVTPGTGNIVPGPQGDTAVFPYGDANIDPDQCLYYDNIWTITKAGVIQFVTWWECTPGNLPTLPATCSGTIETPSSEVLAQINAWPGNSDPTRSQDPYLAPFYDRDDDLVYDPEQGDYPWYDDILGKDDIICGFDRRVSLFGDETHWWVFNDKGNIHTESQGEPIGMEIHAQAFSFATDDEINKMTFYNYLLINRGTQTLQDTYFSHYVDVDLGNYADDFSGCDVSRGLAYMYNGDNNDQTNSSNIGFGQNPPSIGVDFFEGPYQDADGVDNPGPVIDSVTGQLNVPSVAVAIAQKGIVYKGLGIGYGDGIPDNERYGMRNFSIYTGTGGGAGQSDPNSASQFYNYMQGLWQFGAELRYGGTGFPGGPGVSNIKTHYMFPYNSDPLNWATDGVAVPYVDWSEYTPTGPSSAPNPSGDRRFVQSAGPFTLLPGAVNNITVGIVYGRSTEGEAFSSVDAMRVADTKAQALFDNCFRILEPPTAPVVTIQELENELILMLDNPASSNNYLEQYTEEDKINIVDPTGLGDTLPDGSPIIYDKFYRFEGYQIFQMKNAEATVADIDDPTLARPVAQCDIKNGVSRLINFDFDEDLGFATPTEKVDGEDNGIRHTFRVTQDLFATGATELVNHKTYYYLAVAYGYNNYKQYDPNDAAQLDGQKKPYLRSRINADGSPLAAIPAVPHNVAAEMNGTLQNSVYGQTPRITRLDGRGNGNLPLQLTAESEASIISQGKLAKVEYDYNGAPINVKVVDPLNVVGGYFECKFRDYSGATVPNPQTFRGIDTADWVIYRYVDGILVDSVDSQSSVQYQNEQVIPQWGVSVQIQNVKYEDPAEANTFDDLVAQSISASIGYSDTNKAWLTGVVDDNSFSPFNWILGGQYGLATGDTVGAAGWPGLDYVNPYKYRVEGLQDIDEVYSKLLGGTIAPHKLTNYKTDFMPVAYPSTFTQFSTARQRASISRLPSVDIVITSDQTKWTRCVVVELGRNSSLNIGGAQPGTLRNSPSVDKNGNPDGSGTNGMGWFPGYAIDLETGARLHMAFGEASFLGTDNGADMVWNPTGSVVDQNGIYTFGGNQPIWVFGTNIQNSTCPEYDPNDAAKVSWIYDQYQTNTNASLRDMFTSLMWVARPLLAAGHTHMESNVRISLRVNKTYTDYTATGLNGGKPMYSWSMDDLKTVTNSNEALTDEVLDIINVVPNPYYAFSEYERNRIDSRVKITNLPTKCTVSIYNIGGKLVRQFKKDNEITSVDWDLKNAIGVPIASGVYLIHVDVPGAGERVIKFFCGMRQIDLQNI